MLNKKGILITASAFWFSNGYCQQTGKENSIPEDQIYQVVEHMPEFPGGFSGLEKYVKDNTQYPQEAFSQKIEGTVFVQFVIDTNGKATQVKVMNTKSNPILQNEAVRVVSTMPSWKPGTQSGKKVNVYFTVPVPFHVDGKYRIDYPKQDELKMK